MPSTVHYRYKHLETPLEFRARLKLTLSIPFGYYDQELEDWAWEKYKLQPKIIWCEV